MAHSLLLRKEVFKPSNPDSPEAELMQPLLLSQDIQIHERGSNLLVIKNIRVKSYLVVTREEWKLLNRYNKPTSILDLFPDLIRDRSTPALTDLFELLLKARRRFILVTLGTQAPALVAEDWSMRLSYKLANVFSIFCAILAIASLAIKHTFVLPSTLLSGLLVVILGWVSVCASLSLGNFMAACLMHWFEREIFETGWKIGTVFPHWRFDLKDAVMSGVPCETATAQLQVTPMFLLVLVATWLVPPFSIVALLGLLYSLAPMENAPVMRYLQSRFRGPQRSVAHDFVFDTGAGPLGRLKRALGYSSRKYLFIEAAYAVFWMLVSSLIIYSIFGTDRLGEVVSQTVDEEQRSLFSLIMLGAFALSIAILGLNKLLQKIFVTTSTYRPSTRSTLRSF